MQQQQYFEESNPHRLLESLVAISTQDYSIRPVIATVPQPLHRRQPPINVGYDYTYGTDSQGQW